MLIALDYRPRGQHGFIAMKYGPTLIRTLRNLYGESFGLGCQDNQTLSQVLDKIDDSSLCALLRDEQIGRLDSKIARARPAL